MDNIKCILSICDISPFKLGSFEEFLIHLTRKLTAQGTKHVIIFREYPISSVEQALLDEGAVIEVMKPSKHNIINFVKLHSLIKGVKPDIVHFHFYPIYTVLNYLKFFFEIKIVYTDHMGGRKTKSMIKKILRRIYYFSSFVAFDCGVDKIICVSKFVKSKYFNEYGINTKKLEVIYNGINIDKFSKREMSLFKKEYGLNDEFVITCVGLRRDKGPHYLLKAAPYILEEINDAVFFFVGDGECKEYLQSLSAKLNIEDKIIFAGKVPDLSDVYNISSVVVIPSTFEEAFCFVAAEAMATEVPVVAFDSGAIKEVLYDSRFMIRKNHEILALKIVECLRSEINSDNLRLHVMKDFMLDDKISEHIELYSKLNVE